MVNISISEILKSRCPHLRLGCIEADVVVSGSAPQLLSEIDGHISRIQASTYIAEICKVPAIEASRKAYKSCGKDPARYRLSSEALLRRVVSGKGLYQINNVVDQLNLVSITTGFSIGGYDASRIQGDISFGIGRSHEPYSGIGRGELNIENLPVFRDATGAFGSPTSDSQRTEVTDRTKHFLMILIDFDSNNQLGEAMKMAVGLLTDHCQAENIGKFYIQ